MQGRLENEIKINQSVDEMLKTLPSYVTEWYLNLKASRLTATSCQEYIRKIRKFLEYINEEANVSPDDITLQACESYCISCQTRKNDNGMTVYSSDSYQLGIWYALNNFMKFMSNRNYIEQNFMDYISKPKNKDLDRINENRVLLTQRDFQKILKTAKEYDSIMNGIFNNRNVLIVLLFMTTGMRKTALSEINIDDINIGEKTLTVIDKGNKRHTYPLGEQVIDYLDKWLIDRNKLNPNTINNALFINRYGNRLSSHRISTIVVEICEETLGKRLSPHKLRAGFCSILYNKTHDLEFVRRTVGHSNIATTQRYITTDGTERKKALQIMSDILD